MREEARESSKNSVPVGVTQLADSRARCESEASTTLFWKMLQGLCVADAIAGL